MRSLILPSWSPPHDHCINLSKPFILARFPRLSPVKASLFPRHAKVQPLRGNRAALGAESRRGFLFLFLIHHNHLHLTYLPYILVYNPPQKNQELYIHQTTTLNAIQFILPPCYSTRIHIRSIGSLCQDIFL